MKKTIKIVPEVKNKKDNPFLKMRDEDKMWLREHLNSIIYKIAEMQASHQNDYNYLAIERDATFGKSSVKGIPNTALAALAGAAEKMRRGDLSLKQLENIESILRVAHTYWDFPCVEIVNGLQPSNKFEELFA